MEDFKLLLLLCSAEVDLQSRGELLYPVERWGLK